MPKHINHDRNWGFIHVPKTGGTSMEHALGIDGTVHLNAVSQRKKFPQLFLWGFVRHPCDRILSAYYYECKAEGRPTSFDEMSRYISSLPKKVHTLPQVAFTHEGDRLQLDFVGRFELIQEDFVKVCSRLGIAAVTLPVVNRTEHPLWQDCFTSSMIRATRRHFAADFGLFGYDPFSQVDQINESPHRHLAGSKE